MRVAFYARVSTERQQQAQTIEQQVLRLREYVTGQDGWTIEEEHIFRDDGYSGAKLNRPGLDTLRDQAAQARCERVLITAPDRLARNYVHQMVLIEELERVGCLVHFIDRPLSDDPHEQLVLQIRGAVAEYERTLIADRMRRGRQAKLQSGRLLPWTRPPYGYRVDPDQPRDPALVQVDRADAGIVEEIFVAYAEGGATLFSLAKRLTERAVPSPSGRPHWTASGIRYVLTNPAYTGQATWGKTRSVPAVGRKSALQPVGPGKSWRLRPAAEWLTIPIPALIRAEQFARVQQRLATNRQGARRNMKYDYLLRALVSCGSCRLNCTGRQQTSRTRAYRYYVCLGKQAPAVSSRPVPCAARFIPADQLDELVWADLCDVLQHPELVTQALERAQSGAWLSGELRRRRTTLREIGASLARQRERLLTAYLAGVIELPVFEHKDAELQRRQEDVTAQEHEVAAQTQHEIEVQAVAQSIDVICARLRVGLEQATFAQRRQLVELLIDRVIVTNGDVEIRYVIPTTEASTYTRFCQLRTDYFQVIAPGVRLPAPLQVSQRGRLLARRSLPPQPEDRRLALPPGRRSSSTRRTVPWACRRGPRCCPMTPGRTGRRITECSPAHARTSPLPSSSSSRRSATVGSGQVAGSLQTNLAPWRLGRPVLGWVARSGSKEQQRLLRRRMSSTADTSARACAKKATSYPASKTNSGLPAASAAGGRRATNAVIWSMASSVGFVVSATRRTSTGAVQLSRVGLSWAIH
jgi:site-specific DNA recombinase